MISSASLNLIEHVFISIELVYILLVLFNTLVELVFVLPSQITIPPNIFKQHLPKKKIQLEVGEMEIYKMHVWIRIQNLRIIGWTITKEENLISSTWVLEKKTYNKLKLVLI